MRETHAPFFFCYLILLDLAGFSFDAISWNLVLLEFSSVGVQLIQTALLESQMCLS